jgi:hypothetical protein
MKPFALALLLILNMLASIGHAATATTADDDDDTKDGEITDILNSVGYPELQVVPRASERLRMEAKAERGNWFYAHWPMEISGLTTLYVGLSAKANRRDDLSTREESNAKSFASATTMVGLGWVVGGLLLGADKPYGDGMRNISKVEGKKDERSALFRERLSEEALERPAKTMRVLEWASFITNFGANALILDYGNDKGKVIAGIGVVMAFLPFMFEDRSIDLYEKHLEYKKKIYAPIKSASVSYDPRSKTWTPMTNLSWNF